MQLRIALYRKTRSLELGSGWEHSLKRDDECEAQEGHHVVVGQVAASDRRAEWAHLHIARRGGRKVEITSAQLRP